MKPLEKLKDKSGNEILLFPFEYMNISQDEYGSYSHQGILAMDFLGWGKNGRIYKCPYYAPCKMVCVGKSTSAAYNIWNSVNKVVLADGTIDYICLWCIHDDTLSEIGKVVEQGDVLGHTGTSGNVTGDHAHLNIARGHYSGQEQIQGNWQLKNSMHIYNAMYVNDTIIVNGASHKWLTYSGGVTPSGTIKKKKFPWVLYANKFRAYKH